MVPEVSGDGKLTDGAGKALCEENWLIDLADRLPDLFAFKLSAQP
jgi:hypothetical protein